MPRRSRPTAGWQIDLYWFNPADVEGSADAFWTRYAPLYPDVAGYRGVVLNIGITAKLPLPVLDNRRRAWPDWLRAVGVAGEGPAPTLVFEQFQMLAQPVSSGASAALLPP